MSKPYPTDLPIVPAACTQCNNGFSLDERYASYYIKFLYEYYENNNKNILVACHADISEIADAQRAVDNLFKNPIVMKD